MITSLPACCSCTVRERLLRDRLRVSRFKVRLALALLLARALFLALALTLALALALTLIAAWWRRRCHTCLRGVGVRVRVRVRVGVRVRVLQHRLGDARGWG